LWHLLEAILSKKLTQIYHNYLKTPHIGALFFTIFLLTMAFCHLYIVAIMVVTTLGGNAF